ncbi:MAG: hypothetical protein IJP82_07325 [Bacteroidaceae bacterium]|nr:hypothetical protein [Bacteroidaceae bacterium]
MNILKKYGKVLLTIALAVAAWCFWALRYPQALAYHEQIQLFLFDYDFFMERLTTPAGIARYGAEFLVQFYNNLKLGAAIIAMVYVLMQIGVWRLGQRERDESRSVWYALSFVPVLLVWFYMGDENMKFTYVVALLMAQLSMIAYPAKQSAWSKILYAAVAMPMLHWLAGPVVMMLGLYVALKEVLDHKNYALASGAALYSVACIIATAPWVPYPLFRLFVGINYNINLYEVAVIHYIIMLAFVLVPLLIQHLPKLEGKRAQAAGVVATVAVAAMGGFAIPTAYDTDKYEVLHYDFMVRRQQWDKIVATAQKKNPTTPLTVASLNLALGMTGEMNSRAMQFYQNGREGVFPSFNMNFESSLMTAEIYYHLGLVNTAQQFDFEAMEAIPDNTKSARLLKRLAETNLINGQYDVAGKYLKLLQKTLFYKRWADETMRLLGNEDAINNHPVYGQMRRFQLEKDFLFSEQEIDKVMGQLVLQNSQNFLAMQYLLLLPQLEGNQQKYLMYKDFVQKTLNEKKP